LDTSVRIVIIGRQGIRNQIPCRNHNLFRASPSGRVRNRNRSCEAQTHA
jgi:hypothetical protein